jgi:hypothetical protein
MGIIQECKPILAQRERKDLLQFVRKEIVDLKAAAEGMEAVEEVTAEMVVDNLIAKYPENTYTPPPRKNNLTPAQKKYAEALKASSK